MEDIFHWTEVRLEVMATFTVILVFQFLNILSRWELDTSVCDKRSKLHFEMQQEPSACRNIAMVHEDLSTPALK